MPFTVSAEWSYKHILSLENMQLNMSTCNIADDT